MSMCWQFHIDDNDDHNNIAKGMHQLEFTMAACEEVGEIFYGFCHLGGSVAIQGYILFYGQKDKTMVKAMLPDFQVTMMDYIFDSARFMGYLQCHCVFVKLGSLDLDVDVHPIKFDVHWHYIDPATNEHINQM